MTGSRTTPAAAPPGSDHPDPAVAPVLGISRGQAYLLAILSGVCPPGYMWILGLLAWPSPQEPLVVTAAAVFVVMGFLACLFAMALLWGFATERLQYGETEATW